MIHRGDDSQGVLRRPENARKWIGRQERVLILTLVLLQKYEAIGLLVTAKSIFRFSESRNAGEYVLIGTVISYYYSNHCRVSCKYVFVIRRL
jgi:hypothetical protein